MSDSATSWTVVSQASLSMEFSRQEYWSGLPFPSLGNLPNPGIEPISPLSPVSLGRIFTSWVTGEDFWINTSFWTEAEALILWPPDAKNWLIGKDLDAGKDWRREEKGTTKDEMVGWHHRLDGHEFEQALGVGGGQGGLACCGPWGCKESDMTEWLNWMGNLMTSQKLTKGLKELANMLITFMLSIWTIISLNLCFPGVGKTFPLN